MKPSRYIPQPIEHCLHQMLSMILWNSPVSVTELLRMKEMRGPKEIQLLNSLHIHILGIQILTRLSTSLDRESVIVVIIVNSKFP